MSEKLKEGLLISFGILLFMCVLCAPIMVETEADRQIKKHIEIENLRLLKMKLQLENEIKKIKEEGKNEES